MQHWYNMSDPTMEGTLYKITSMCLFADLSLNSPILGHTIIMNFMTFIRKTLSHLPFFKKVNRRLPDAGIHLKEGTIVDTTIIEPASLSKNKATKRDPKMHQNQKEK
ncbi:MAG: IS5 family transposase [Oceanicoccus sp.]|jgi:IS5 family transposase